MSEAHSDMTVPPSSDPLVPRDFNEWTLNVYGIFKRSGYRIMGIVLLWSIIPVVAGVWTSSQLLRITDRLNKALPADQTTLTPAQTETMWAHVTEALSWSGIAVAVSLALSYFTASGWAAALRVAVTDAAGKPIGFGEAMAYGARKGLSMWGWYLLVSLCALVGACLCVLPGLYMAVAFALFAPVVVLEGGMAMARSFRLVHNAFGKMLGRIALSFAGVLSVGLVLYVLQVLIAGFGLGSDGMSPSSPLDLFTDGVFALASAVLTAVILISGLLVTYAEARAREDGSATTVELLERSPS